MNKAELVAAIAAKTEVTKKDAEAMVNAYSEIIGDAMQAGDSVQLIGFGTFKPYAKKATTGRNPSTGAKITIPAKTVAKFVPGKALAEKVNTPAKKAKKK